MARSRQNGVQEAAGSDGDDAVLTAMNAITELTTKRLLVPGEQIRQEDLGRQLGLSRGPVREALKALSAQRILEYSRHRGYFVAQLNADEMDQLYTLRRLGETVLLRSTDKPTATELAHLRELNEQIFKAERVDELSQLNDRFHLEILGLSSKKLILQEVERWWAVAAGYRGLVLAVVDRNTVHDHHAAMIAAVASGDLDRLVEVADEHRLAAQKALLPLLPES